ncbi:MAG: ABC transporter ATP-binding protein/permease [Erysipelotrichaceae bacterium]|jgi:ATP-binding cassette subfamily B protein|nr:ABC transporter ATP-binding protein/permease [Erysipelotrichaceae bacterium]
MLKLLKFSKKLWWAIAIILVFIVAQAWMQLQLPELMRQILDTIQDFNIAGDEKINKVWEIGGIMLAYCLAIIASALVVGILNALVGATYARNIREQIFNKIMHFSLREFSMFGTASLLTRTTNDINTTKDTYMMFQRTVIFSPVILVIAIVQAFTADPTISLVYAVTSPILIIAIIITFCIASPLFTKLQTKLDNVTMVLREGLTGVRVIRAFNQQEREFVRFSEKNQEMTNTIIKVGRTMSFIDPIINIVFNITALGIYFVGFAILDGNPLGPSQAATISNVALISNYSMNIMMSFLMLGMIFIQLPRASASAKRIWAVLNVNLSVRNPAEPVDISTIKEHGVVEFKHVTFTFPGAAEPTLKDISFKTKPGKTTAIIGSTGSGKSSIINLIPRFYDVTIGSVLVDGVDVRNYAQKDLRDKIGFVPQQARLFTGTIKDNLLYGDPGATMDQLNEALEVAQAKHFVDKKEKGILSEVAQGGKNFSGGQKQRLAIARALVKKPEVYIFDDSFSALDFKTDIRLRTALKSYIKDSSIIVVAQRVSSIMDADNILVLNEGVIVGQGKHDELLESCPIYEQIVMSQLDEDDIKKTRAMNQNVLSHPETEGGDE